MNEEEVWRRTMALATTSVVLAGHLEAFVLVDHFGQDYTFPTLAGFLTAFLVGMWVYTLVSKP